MKKNKKAFTLIEVIVVIGVVALVIPAIYSIIFSILKQQILLYQITQVKRQGDFALNTMQESIRPIVSIIHEEGGLQTADVCKSIDYTSDPQYTIFKGKDNVEFRFYTSRASKLIYRTGFSNNLLTNEKVLISNLSISCKRTVASPAIVKVSFTIKYNTKQTLNSSLNYSSSIVLRNY